MNHLKLMYSKCSFVCRDNLHVLDHVTLMYVSGNLVHFLNTETRQMTYLRYKA